jgi:hypothetical protein
MGCAGADAQLH